ncbi:hypothetical protein GGF31_001146 [Allomyces arbusculus]|nr:hypothetical protein GGF31_001146 [Allomyces arbusculus]
MQWVTKILDVLKPPPPLSSSHMHSPSNLSTPSLSYVAAYANPSLFAEGRVKQGERGKEGPTRFDMVQAIKFGQYHVSSAKKKFCDTKGLEGATIAYRVADLVRPVISLGFPSSSSNSGCDQGNGTSTAAPTALDEGELTMIDIASLAAKLKGEKITGGIVQAIADILMLTTTVAHIVKDECSNKSLTAYRRNYLVNAHKTDKIDSFEEHYPLDPSNIVKLFFAYDDQRTTAGLPKPTDLLKFYEPIKEAREYFTGKRFERAFRRTCLFAIYGPAAVLLSSEKRSDFLNVGKWTKEEFRGKLGALVDKPALIKDALEILSSTGVQTLLDARVVSQMHRFRVESVGWVDVSKNALSVLGFPAGVGYFAQVSEEGV